MNDRKDDCLASIEVNEAGNINFKILERELPNDFPLIPRVPLADDQDSNIGGCEVSHGLAAIPTPKASLLSISDVDKVLASNDVTRKRKRCLL